MLENKSNYKELEQNLNGALKLRHAQSKQEHILQNKKQKELDKMRLFALKQQKKKEKHKGH